MVSVVAFVVAQGVAAVAVVSVGIVVVARCRSVIEVIAKGDLVVVGCGVGGNSQRGQMLIVACSWSQGVVVAASQRRLCSWGCGAEC